ncbi:VOC family protein [Paludibacterium sp. THUN1379]|uniref:VOC family protein n=1 Tax=Paludibacterium sp. THUN1379 TaxID=3112107 RepID=UPI0030858E41|nr:VOC family protein [Paludibacterium sp. THUN1379]
MKTLSHYVLLFVDSPERSAAFYQPLLGLQPVEQSPTFALFLLSDTLKLGLWSRHTAEPAPTGHAGMSELTFCLESNDAVDACHAQWLTMAVPMLQAPCEMDFGRTFVAQDPDGHRLRVFASNGQ